MRKSGALAGPYRTILLAGILAGIMLIVLAAGILVQLLIFPFEGSTGAGFILFDASIIETVNFTVFQASLSTVFSIVIGAILAWSLANNSDFPFRNTLVALISSALVLPTLVVVLGVVTVYGRNGWLADLSFGLFSKKLPFSIYGLGGILLAHIFFNASFACRVFLHRFESIPDEKHKLCFALGTGFWRRLLLVEFPAIVSVLPNLAITIFLLCFTSFAIVLTLGGSPAYNTLEVAIYEAVRFDFDLFRAFQLAMIQIIICIFLVTLANAGGLPNSSAASVKHMPRYRFLYSAGERWFQVFIIAIFSVFFITPLLAVLADGVGPQLIGLLTKETFRKAFVTSISVALVSTILALFLSFVIASATATLTLPDRLNLLRHRLPILSSVTMTRFLAALLSMSAMLYLVFPALVMGLGFFLFHQSFGGNPKIWAICVVTLSNALISIPFVVALLRPAILAAAKKHDRLSNSLGLGKWHRWTKIEWPTLKNDITYAAALSFCFSLGDLGVIALFGSEDFKTLPWLLYQNFGSYRTNEAGAIALILLVLIISVFSLAQPSADRSKTN